MAFGLGSVPDIALIIDNSRGQNPGLPEGYILYRGRNYEGMTMSWERGQRERLDVPIHIDSVTVIPPEQAAQFMQEQPALDTTKKAIEP
jgi:hypothetical protein